VWNGTDCRAVAFLRRRHLYGSWTEEGLMAQSQRPNSGVPQPEVTSARLFMLFLLYSTPLIQATRPVVDNDVWWHLRTGQWILQHGAVPSVDPFSSFGHDKPWVAYSWLFEVLIYRLYDWLGLYGVLLYRLLLTCAVLVAIHRFIARREPRFAVATGLTGLVFLTTIPLLSERPWMFTVLFFTLTLGVVFDLREGRTRPGIWILPIVFALWANLHVQFIYGLFLLTLACVAPCLDSMLGRSPGSNADLAGSRPWRQLVGLTLACWTATVLSPYHLRLYGVVLDYATQPKAFDIIAEHHAMDFRDIGAWAVLALALTAAFVLGRRRRVTAFDFLLLAASAYLSFHTQRDLWMIVLTAAALLTTPDALALPISLERRFTLTHKQLGILGGGMIMVIGLTAWQRDLTVSGMDRAIRNSFPDQAAAFIESRHLEGPIYNKLDWGGFLIWRLPGLPVAIDGRTNLHGEQRLSRSLDTWLGYRGWDTDPEFKAARVVIADVRCPLASLLRLDITRFDMVYEDDVAAVFVDRTAREHDAP
jgi:hypothetical protein